MKYDIHEQSGPGIRFSAKINCLAATTPERKLGLAVAAAANAGVDLTDANLEGADLYGANLEGVDLSGSNLVRAKLVGARLVGAKLSNIVASQANFTYANLMRARLDGSSLVRATLVDADLTDANLCGTNAMDANFYRANLEGANLEGVELGGANLTDVNHLISLNRPDRWHAYAWLRDGCLSIRVGCREMRLGEARAHWYGKEHRREVMAAVEYAAAIAAIRRWPTEPL